jgi:hypothetical protein
MREIAMATVRSTAGVARASGVVAGRPSSTACGQAVLPAAGRALAHRLRRLALACALRRLAAYQAGRRDHGSGGWMVDGTCADAFEMAIRILELAGSPDCGRR